MIVPGWRAAIWWIALALVCLALAMFALQGYLSPSAMIDFANMKLCALAAPFGIIGRSDVNPSP